MILFYFLLAITLAVIFALLEIQIEGANGWAQKLPTWKVYYPFFKYMPGGNKQITGYHFYTWIMLTLYPHIVFLFVNWSLSTELLILSFVVFVLRLEDFLWFVFNPHFGLSKFKKGLISWHSQWLFGLPVQYYFSFALWVILFYLGLKTI